MYSVTLSKLQITFYLLHYVTAISYQNFPQIRAIYLTTLYI